MAVGPVMPYLAGMASDPTFGDLYKAKAILTADFEATIEALMADPTTGLRAARLVWAMNTGLRRR